jgi:hypothetical protein
MAWGEWGGLKTLFEPFMPLMLPEDDSLDGSMLGILVGVVDVCGVVVVSLVGLELLVA